MFCYTRPLVCGVIIALSACAQSDLSPKRTAVDAFISQNDWNGAISYYRDALQKDPGNADLRGGYFAISEKVVENFLTRSRRFSDAGDVSNAEGQISQGLLLVPDSIALRDELERLQDMRRARALYRDAKVAADQGRYQKAFGLLERTLGFDPNYINALKLYETLIAQSRSDTSLEPIRLQTGAPVSINFKDASFKEAVLALGKAYGVNMIFDSDVEDRPVSIFAENVQFSQALELVLKSNRSFYRRLGKNSLVIVGDNPEKRAEYEDYLVRTFFLETAEAQTMADLLTRSLGIQNVTANEANNSLTVRETSARIALADQLLNLNDREPAEVVLEVEILEVNRTKSEQLGLSFGSQISVSPPGLELGQIIPVEGFGDLLATSAVTLPAATFRFFKQDVDARTLASPRIRTINREEAVIHVGDRVPLRASTVQDSTGQTRTSFEYRDVGIKLNVTPEVRLDSSVAVDLNLEVSSLGQNLGTAEEPAFAIGTRNISTSMKLDDGETAIIGGLIRDEERDSVQRLPGTGETSALGRLFRQRDGQNTRTDILLTLTPRLVRGLAMPNVAESEFYSGTGSRVTDEKPFDFLASSNSGSLPTIRLDLSGSAIAGSSASLREGVQLPAPKVSNPAQSNQSPVLAFVRSSYSVSVGDKVDVAVTAAGFPEVTNGNLIVRYRKDLVRAEEVSTNANIPYSIDADKGQIEFQLTPLVSGAQNREIAKIQFTGVQKGVSYLIFANSLSKEGREGLPENVELQASRIAVR